MPKIPQIASLKLPSAILSKNRQQATGNRQQATGNRQQATGNRQLYTSLNKSSQLTNSVYFPPFWKNVPRPLALSKAAWGFFISILFSSFGGVLR